MTGPGETRGLVFNIQRYCVHDGPGIRTTVFLKGCNLRCRWCENPESMSAAPQIAFSRTKCIQCGRCRDACGEGAVIPGNEIIVDFDACNNCGICAAACPSGALEMIGKWMSSEEVLSAVMKDEAFYRNSGGGVTLSGGEPTMQFEFSLDLARLLKGKGLHTVLETNGFARPERVQRLSEYIDIWYFDIKGIDREKHMYNTARDNLLIHRNARWLVENGHKVVFRIPLIPGFNTEPSDTEALKRFLDTFPAQETQYIPYHSLGEGKLPGIKTDQKPLPRGSWPSETKERA